jgi:hypothetical protein
LLVWLALNFSAAAQVALVDSSRYSPDCGIEIRAVGPLLQVHWPMGQGELGRLTLDLRPDQPLMESLGVGLANTSVYAPMLRGVDVTHFMTVGTRMAPPGQPPGMSVWNVFFDKVPDRPTRTHRSQLDKRRVWVTSRGRRATVAISDLTIGPFAGRLEMHFYTGSRLLHIEAVVRTEEDRRAFLYDAGLVGAKAGWQRVAWMDTDGLFQRLTINENFKTAPLKVRHRAILVENERGALACLPPPHQFFDPRDYSDNLSTTWAGAGYEGVADFSFGVRHSPRGGGNYQPWFNAPPGTAQRLGMFLVLARGDALAAFGEAMKYTRGDRFAELPGHKTFTSHYHLAHTVDAMKRKEQGTWKAGWEPEFVQQFKRMGVDIVHLGEFHGDGHPKDPGAIRLAENAAMFDECRRLSTDSFLLLPGEEINDYLGIKETGKHPGHWMSFFPKPVQWIELTRPRTPTQPFVEEHPQYGRVYRVGDTADMVKLLELENGLAWSAHPRIKASNWTPDIFKDADFYQSPTWLGGAFKAMPGDLSREKLGERCLDLLNDMANWGPRKYLPGEVDTFKLFNDHEIYGHMNINYLRLDKLPRFDDGWQPVLDTLRHGAFFTTTGEVLIKDFTVNGQRSGGEFALPVDGLAEVKVDLEWTFPLKFAEVISGDGTRIHRERIELADTGAFGKRSLTLKPDLRGRKWVRFEAWDVAVNGAYTQPVWLK